MTLSIAHVIELSEAETGASFSGAENHLFALAVGQARRGHDVTIYALVGTPGPTLDRRAQELRHEGVGWESVGPRRRHRGLRRRLLRVFTALRLVLLFARRRPDVVHTHLLVASQVGRAAAWLVRCGAVVESTHCDEPLYRQPGLRRRLRALDRITDRHIAITHHVRDYLVDALGIDAGRIDVVYYGVELPSGEPNRATTRALLGIPDDRYVAVFVGRLTEQKFVDIFLDAIRRVGDVTGLVVGSGPLEPELRRMAASLDADVRFLGFRSDAGAVMAASDVLCLPSRWEGLGLVLLEAMARHVPTIGAAAGAIPEVLGDGRFGLVVPVGDAQALADAIVSLRSDPASARELAAGAYDRVCREFTVDAMVDATLATYTRARR